MLVKKVLLSICALGMLVSVGLADPYAKYKGETIVASWPALDHYKKAKTLVKEFTKETGIKVEIDYLPYLKLRDRQILEMSKRKGEYDVVSWVVMWKTEYVSKGLLTPLAEFYAKPSLVDPDYDIDDIAMAYLKSGGTIGGKLGYLPGPGSALYGIPFSAETSFMAYRKDIFTKYNIAVPKTYAQLDKAIDKLHAKGLPAATVRGKTGHHIVDAYLLHLSPMGGKIFDEKFNPVFNSPEAVKAAEFLRKTIKTGPKGVTTFGFGEAAAALLQGDAMIYIGSNKIAAMSRDKRLSKMDGKIGFALHPTDMRCGSKTGGFAMGIPANSRKKEAAFLFIQYITSKKADQRMVELGGNPIRISTLENPSNKRKYPDYAVTAKQLPCADADWRPLIPVWNEINVDILGQALGKIVSTDGPVKPILDDAVKKARKVMKRNGYYNWR